MEIVGACVVVGLALTASVALGADEEPLRATITIDAGQVIRPVPPLWLGHNVEWVAKGQGLFQEDGSGAKPGVVELIKPLNPGLIRYPGGSLANTFRWADSIGPLAQRKPVTNFFEKTGEVPLLGFDDFMKFVEQVDAQGAIIIVNCNVWPKNPENSGSAQEAAAWVAYANAEAGAPPVPIGKDGRGMDWQDSQYWANLRVTNGHPRPYDVLHWEIGNEIYDSKQGAGLTPETYAARVIEFSGLMKQVDPRIKVGVIDWREGNWGKAPRLVAETPGAADFRIVHSYVSGGKGLFNYQTGFRDTGDREYTFTSSAGKHTLTVVAWGRPLKGIGPRMKVELDGAELGTETVQAVSGEKGEVTDTFAYERELEAGDHTLAVRFLNPEPPAGAPYRDLYLKSIVLRPQDGAAQPIPTDNLDLLMVKNAGQTEKLVPEPLANAKGTPGVLPFHRTEYGCIDAEDNYGHCCDQKTAVFAARIAQASLIDGDCAGANYWCIRGGPFRILDFAPGGGFRYTPAGIVFRTLAPLAEGEAVMTRYDGPTFMASWLSFARKRGWAAAVAVKRPGLIAVNLLSYHPSRPITVALECDGVDIKPGRARTISLAGPGPEAMNADGKSPLVTMEEGEIDVGPATAIVLQPCSVTTVILETTNR